MCPLDREPGIANLSSQKANSWRFFDRLAKRYDLANHILSFGLDIFWRRRLIQAAQAERPQTVLDVATGTGAMLIPLCQHLPGTIAYGIDLSKEMLGVAANEIKRRGLEKQVSLVMEDAHRLYFPDGKFDIVTVAFGIRNMTNPSQVLAEIRRVLVKGGKLFILEFSLPENPIVRSLCLAYLRLVLRLVGGMIAGTPDAYHYLHETILRFPSGQAFAALLTREGFQQVTITRLFPGIATIYRAEK